MIERILRQTAESESFRCIVERRHLLEAAAEIERLRTELAELREKAAKWDETQRIWGTNG